MKELYRNEILSLRVELTGYDKELEQEFFEYRNRDIEEVLVEIRAGKIYFSLSSGNYFRFWWCRGCFVCWRAMRFV